VFYYGVIKQLNYFKNCPGNFMVIFYRIYFVCLNQILIVHANSQWKCKTPNSLFLQSSTFLGHEIIWYWSVLGLWPIYRYYNVVYITLIKWIPWRCNFSFISDIAKPITNSLLANTGQEMILRFNISLPYWATNVRISLPIKRGLHTSEADTLTGYQKCLDKSYQ